MKDIEKTETRSASKGNKNRRKQNLRLYYIIITGIILTTAIALSFTMLFNIDSFVVQGDTQYLSADIITASGIQNGDNLIRISTKQSEENILSTLLYVDSVEVKRKFPSSVIITVTPCIPQYNVLTDECSLLVSAGGKILDRLEKPIEGLLTVEGFPTLTFTPFERLSCDDETLPDILYLLGNAIEAHSITSIKSLNLSDKYDITLNYENRITISIGNSSDADYKLNYAKRVLSESIDADERGYFILHDGNEASFVSEEDMESYRKGVEDALSGTTTAPAVTDLSDASGTTTESQPQ